MDALLPDDPDRIGPYRLEGRLGAGGMGEVFLARSPGGRVVVVKRIHRHHAGKPEYRARFAREIDAARRVGGHYTAQVVAADPDADRPWMVTAHIPGPSLQALISERGPLPADGVAALAAGLAEGLAAIHDCGLVHRDLKPGNVICAGDGPRIIDFGIARPLEASTLTEAGALVGTCAYMSPEQINGHPATSAADVFALGCVLGFAATGQGPFHAGSLPAIVRRVTSEDPDLSGVPATHGLRDLVAACLAKNPADRPAVTDVLAGLVRSDTDRHPPLTTRESKTPSALPRRALLAAGLGLGGTIVAVAISRAFGAASGTPAETPSATTVPIQVVKVADVTAHQQGVFAVAFHPEGALLATGGGGEENVRLWDVTDHSRPVAVDHLDHDDWVAALAFNHDGTLLATGGYDRTVRLWDVARRALVTTLTGHTGWVTSLAFTRDGTLLAGGGADLSVQLWDVPGRTVSATLNGHTDAILAVAFSPDGTLLATGGMDRTVRLWDLAAGTLADVLTGAGDDVNSVAFSPDGNLLAVGSADETVRLWKIS
ncbi:WD40 repeat domain-containing serine/threonine protein kinase [Herbidospora mongoliensis]|uniref:WD40 repeat domain-containing serine/threonine protein kinase n=1 Tax=Herbidospora mongoliensis TaxID=688067 RepID=UPI00082F1476|nr:serine/threonine-protein kinase [Herbidospora mongoliensis]